MKRLPEVAVCDGLGQADEHCHVGDLVNSLHILAQHLINNDEVDILDDKLLQLSIGDGNGLE